MRYMIADDLVCENQSDIDDYRNVFEGDIEISDSKGIFVPSYEKAIQSVREHPDIGLIIADLKMPKSIKHQANQNFDYWGLKLIPDIYKINNKVKIIIHSAHIDETFVNDEIKKIKKIPTVIGCHGKPELIPLRSWYYKKIKNGPLELSNQDIFIDTFNYEVLPQGVPDFIHERVNRINKRVRENLINNYKIGLDLIEIKKKLGKRGQFTDWVQNGLGWHIRTVQKFMSVSRSFRLKEIESLAEFGVSTYLLDDLTKKEISTEIRSDILKRIKSGENINCNTIKAILDEYKSEPKESSQIIDIQATQIGLYESKTETNLQSSKTSDKKQEIYKVLAPKRSWVMGNRKHIIVSLDPNSDSFLSYLPRDIEFNLIFPPSMNWQAPEIKSETTMSFLSTFKDPDSELLLEGIKSIIESHSQRNSDVVIQFIPHVNILLLLEKLECRAFIADSDRDKCLDLMKNSKILDPDLELD